MCVCACMLCCKNLSFIVIICISESLVIPRIWLCRVESALQQNEILDVFFDDWAALTIDDGSFGSKADNHLKVWNDYVLLQCVPKSSTPNYVAITLSVLNGFSKLFHCWKENYIYNKTHIILCTIPHQLAKVRSSNFW